jgi:hypothetical protein
MANYNPTHTTDHPRFRQALAVVAAVAGGLGILGVAFALLGTISPGEAVWLWVGSALLLALWVAGARWRGDAPDARTMQSERERRGF